MRKLLLLFACFGIISCKSHKLTAESEEKYQLENLSEVISRKNIDNIYPDANIAEGTDLFEEGTVERPYTILYPHTKDEILIVWQDASRSTPEQIYVDREGRWSSKKGIKVGTSYEELEEINNGPIKFYGFGWDYSGAVDWNEGKMADSDVQVFLAPENAPPQSFYGDHIIEEDPEKIINLHLKVRAIVFKKS
ncbi:MAG: hypothetical protein WBL27_01490 [Salinimicrobium sp.]